MSEDLSQQASSARMRRIRALCFMLGIPNSVPNGYFQVRRARVTGNTFVNCEHNILIGLSGHKNASLPPVESEISGNAIQTSKGEAFEINCATDGITIKDNQTGREALRLAEPAVPEPAGPAWRK